jgi:Zc3h12a-like ribonuclease protein
VSPIRSTRLRVVVDGSNFATEGRVTPSLAQLDEAVRAFMEEHPNAEIIVVADASFEHRVAPNERAHFKAAELAGEIVTPPAGAIGRGDAFILKIADRIKGVVLSNDSFQEFHDEYPWLFDDGRLIGGKPVKGVGWVFTPRLPVRNSKTTRPVKKLSVTLSNGATPSIGTTLTPVKAAKKKAPTKVAKAPVKGAPAKAPAPTKDKKSHKVDLAEKKPVKAAKKSPVKVAKTPPKPKKVTKTAAVAPPAVALRRGRHPVNPEADFALFRSAHRIGSRVEGEVTDFTSHGAVIRVALKTGQLIECYAPTTSLGNPAPARARDVLKRGDRRTFRLVAVDAERRIAELALL